MNSQTPQELYQVICDTRTHEPDRTMWVIRWHNTNRGLYEFGKHYFRFLPFQPLRWVTLRTGPPDEYATNFLFFKFATPVDLDVIFWENDDDWMIYPSNGLNEEMITLADIFIYQCSSSVNCINSLQPCPCCNIC